MKPFQLPPLDTDFVNTPRGVLTPGGLLFHVGIDELNSWAGELFKHVSLRELLAGVSAWQSVPVSLVLWLTPVLMFWFNPWIVAAAALVSVPLLRAVLPPLINPPFVSLGRYLNLVGIQGLYYIAFLTVLSRMTSAVHVLVALGIYVLLRSRLVDPLFAKIGDWIGSRLYRLAPVDVALRTLIINSAAQYGIQLEGHEKFGTRGRLFSIV
ncbi:MAG: hypothetical protein HKN43_08805 [Rhodothermales bacterium]|nr:hypothetical protein [Rhodothermales bacterium]